MGFRLRDSISYCQARDRIVLLDVQDDQYFCLPSDTDVAFRNLVADRPFDRDSLSALLTEGILIETDLGTSLQPACMPPPTRSLVDGRQNPSSPTRQLTAALLQLRARNQLKQRPLIEILATLKTLRLRRAAAADIDLPKTTLIWARAFKASSIFLSSNSRCLPTSIALVRYLRRLGSQARLVIGVRIQPFGAHAWIQEDDVVVNDSIENVLPYTPILVV